MSSSRPFMHPDFDRAVLELPLRPKQRALLVALGDLGSGNGAPSVDADALMTEMARRSGAPVTSGNFRQQLSRLNRALGDAEAPFSLGSRAGRITVEPSVHWNRASQLDSVRQALVEHSGEKMRADIDSFVAPRAAATHLLVMWSYAWLQGEQQAIQIELFEALKAKLAAPPARYQHLPRIEMWRDEERINLAEEGTAQMDDACARAFLGLLVYSDRYPHSTPCKRETDYFLDEEGGNLPEKRSIVLRFNCAAGDMQPRFLRRIVYPGGAEDAFLDQWVKGDAADRNKLVNDLALQIFENATEFCGREPNPSPPSEPGGRLKKGRVESFMARQPERMRHDDTHSTPPLARAGAHGYDAANPAGTEDPAGIDIVERIIEWSASSDPLRARVTALLGDFGMGKTVTCQLVCRRMIERTDEGQALPTPVYFDLRDIPRPEHPEQVTLESLIDDLLRQSGESTLRASEVIDFIRSRDALVIFDGLDEITNKYSMDVARIIYRQLIGIVPASIWREDARRRIDNRNGAAPAATRRHGPSILMSCRSQYFADFAAERGFLSDADRFGLKLQEDIAVYVMLPFSPKQIRDYIRRNLPSEDHDRALSLIESTYDLSELARRPILLRYMSELIHRLEAEKLAGREISLSGLYDILVRQAFERDSPKHVIPIPDKKRLLQALALHLHGREREDISNERLIQWLDLEIGANFPKLAGALRGAEGLRLSEIFVQDLRNATLLSRPAESGFRFGHTSLREYFLAGALYEAVLEGNGESGWAVKVPSKETIDFLLQHHSAQEAPEKEAFAAQFRSLLEPERPLAVRKLAFAVWRQSFATASPLPRPREIDCSGFQLQGEELIGSRSKLLPLAGSLWHGADLRQALVQDVDLTGADFTEVRAVSAKFVRCALRDARFHDADLAGSLWRDVHLNSSALEGAGLRLAEGYSSTVGGLPWRPQAAPPPEAREWRLERTENLGRATWVAGGQLQGRSVFAVAARKEVRILDAATGVALRTLRSHAATTCAAFLTSEQRNWVAAAREDGSVGIWDVDSAELLRNLHFNDGSVGYLRFAEVEGMPIVVAGDWDSLGVWDAVSGEKLRTVEPKDSISSIAVGHDGHRSVLALGTRGRRIILYDLETGETIKTIGETTGVPHALALAALDGELMLVSGGTDTIVRLQSVETGRVVRTFEGHLDWVRAVEVMEEGGRQLLVSAGDDNAVRFWNVRTGESLATGVGHQQWVRCVAGVALGDRGLVASGGDDGTIRLWELESGEPAGVFGGPMGWSGVVSSAGPDERLIAALIGDDNKIEIWDVATSRLLHTIMAPNSSGITLSLHEVKQRLLLAWTGAEARVLVWDALTADLLHSSIVDSAGIRSAQIVALQDGPGLLMVSNAGTATLTDLSDGKVLQSVEDVGSAPFPAFFLLHGQPHLVHTSDDGLTVRSMVSGTTARRIETDLGPLGAMSVVEIGGEPHLAAIGNRGIVKIWKPATGRLVRSIDMQGRRVNSLEHKNFEGRDLLGWSSEDGWIGAYDLADGKSVFVHNTPSGWANSLSLGRVGKNLVCVSADEDGIAAFRWIESGQITRTTMVKHGSGIAVTVVPGTDGNDRIVAADPEAWKCFRASYRANGSQAITGIDDMPRAEAAPD